MALVPFFVDAKEEGFDRSLGDENRSIFVCCAIKLLITEAFEASLQQRARFERLKVTLGREWRCLVQTQGGPGQGVHGALGQIEC